MSNKIVPVMPPLLEEERFVKQSGESHYIGRSAEKLVGSYVLQNGINFAEPEVDKGVDLWIQDNENPKQVKRGQVKKVLWNNKLDHKMNKRNGSEVYRDTFEFRFQSSGSRKKCRWYGPNEIDLYYHVLITPHRQIIFEIPSSIIPINSKYNNETVFVQYRNAVLERGEIIRRKSDIDIRGRIVYSMYDLEVIRSFPEFFVPSQNQITLLDFVK